MFGGACTPPGLFLFFRGFEAREGGVGWFGTGVVVLLFGGWVVFFCAVGGTMCVWFKRLVFLSGAPVEMVGGGI